MLTRPRFGLLGGLLVGAAMAWWQWRQRSSLPPFSDRGETIFRNTPQPSTP
jgi:hypothetical protein